jgi:hypothetical protein
MFKKSYIGILISSVFLLTGCFGGGDSTDEGQLHNFSTFAAPAFSISVPQQWEVIEPKDFSKDIPNETQIIFRDNIQNDIFTPNANVTKRLLRTQATSVEFGKSVIQENKNTLLNYREISRDEEFNIVIGGQLQKSILIMFEGKQSEQEPTIRVVQTYAINGIDAYVATAAYLPDSSEILAENAKNIVKSFKVN